jgi:hypothetical protein
MITEHGIIQNQPIIAEDIEELKWTLQQMIYCCDKPTLKGMADFIYEEDFKLTIFTIKRFGKTLNGKYMWGKAFL